ncbi:MAG: hypothetical protein IPO22_21555 [Anaerolineales bacterium]|nr:hypothetical protein [Anaerolineales bacterium]
MKKLILFLFIAIFLSSCTGWGVAPQPFPVLTPIPSSTPGIVTPTPFIIPPPIFGETSTPSTNVTVISPVTPENTFTPTPTLTFTPIQPTVTFTFVPVQSANLVILGCNTSIDITHGMGEVTNAFVTVKNNGTIDLPNTCAILRAIDEDREHPNKKVCLSNLPAQNEVNLKLTVDSQYKVDTIIQVDITSNEVTLLRLDKQSCKDISLFGGAPSDLDQIKPLTP